MRSNLGQIALVCTSAALIFSNIYLVIEDRRLSHSLEQAKRYVTDVGYRFSHLTSYTLEGKEEPLSFVQDEKHTLLFVFRPSCEYCTQQYPQWRFLVETIDRSKWGILAITSEENGDLVRQHLEAAGFTGLDTRMIPKEEMATARLMYTPMTLIVDSNGIVRKVWPGLWTKEFDLSF